MTGLSAPVDLGTGPSAEFALGQALGTILINLKAEKAKSPAPSTVQELIDILGMSLPAFLLAAQSFASVGNDFSISPIQSSKALICPILDALSSYLGK